MRGKATIALGAVAVLGAAAPVEWGFSKGLDPLPLTGAPTAAECGECHEQEHAAWQLSGHRRAHTSPLYAAGLVAEPSAFCVHCHSPRPDQVAQVLPQLDAIASHNPARGQSPRPVAATPRADDGVDCAACHWRDGQVLGAEELSWGPHRVAASATLTDGTLCRGCHEFEMFVLASGTVKLTDEPMQSTFSEWESWRAEGGTETCVDCHFPGADHSTHRGASDRAALRSSVQVDVSSTDEEVTFTLSTVGVGHAVPTGDLFRHITLEVEGPQGWETISWLGRRFDTRIDPASGEVHKVQTSDGRLFPGRPRLVRTPAATGERWRLRWHDGSVDDEQRGLVDLDDQVVVLHAGRIDR